MQKRPSSHPPALKKSETPDFGKFWQVLVAHEKDRSAHAMIQRGLSEAEVWAALMQGTPMPILRTGSEKPIAVDTPQTNGSMEKSSASIMREMRQRQAELLERDKRVIKQMKPH